MRSHPSKFDDREDEQSYGTFYEVKENCVGTLRWDAVLGGTCGQGLSIGERTATVTIGKKDVYILSTTAGAVLVGIATKR